MSGAGQDGEENLDFSYLRTRKDCVPGGNLNLRLEYEIAALL